jgi:hypothetical protein
VKKFLLLGAVAATQILVAGAALADTGPVYAAYTGSQQGVTDRDASLVQQNAFNTGINASGVAVNNTDIYLSSGNHLLDYTIGGGLVQDFAFPDPNINYTGIATKDSRVFATYTGSQQGVTVRDLNLVQLSSFSTGIEATGIAAGDGGHLYLSSGNHLLDYLTDGTLITNMTFPDEGILYSAIAYGNNTVYAAYQGSQQGVTLRDLNLNQYFSFNTGFDISGIAVGLNNDLYLASGNSIYNYSTGGALLNTMTFPDGQINYSAIAINAGVPEPGTWALMILGFGGVGAMIRRRKSGMALAAA